MTDYWSSFELIFSLSFKLLHQKHPLNIPIDKRRRFLLKKRVPLPSLTLYHSGRLSPTSYTGML